MAKAQSEKKCKYIYIYIYQMLPDVIQTGKYGTAAKENVLQILLHIQMILYTSNA